MKDITKMTEEYTIRKLKTRANKYESMSPEELKKEYSFLAKGLNKYRESSKPLPTELLISKDSVGTAGLLKILNQSLIIDIEAHKSKR